VKHYFSKLTYIYISGMSIYHILLSIFNIFFSKIIFYNVFLVGKSCKYVPCRMDNTSVYSVHFCTRTSVTRQCARTNGKRIGQPFPIYDMHSIRVAFRPYLNTVQCAFHKIFTARALVVNNFLMFLSFFL
jgi:hypothetical protein